MKSAKDNYELLEGSQAIARTIKNLEPAVISAYPITPQTHIVEILAKYKADGLVNCEYVRAESEFAAASIVLGASAAGARVYSATSSQGLLLMTEVIFNIAGMRLPVVMTCANRSVSAPINIWNDHSDVMAIRDTGWILLFAANHQEAVDQHVLAYKLAEKLNLPVMVNVDGFIITHSYESVIIPELSLIKKYLPDYNPLLGTYLNPDAPVTLGAFFTPDYYQEARQTLHQDLLASQTVIKEEYKLYKKLSARQEAGMAKPAIDNGLIEYYGPKKPNLILVALGSVIGTIQETIKSENIGLLKIKTYRPFPGEEIAKILSSAKNVAVIEKAISLGNMGPLYSDIRGALTKNNRLNISNHIVGLGGRDVTKKIIKGIIKSASGRANEAKFWG
ncbi:MAG: pyruvate ferredoxin oxidoreductase [Candidatus Falkowbacteria bacterium]|nr:pyruvate ferredoxin oxidoreductase [Candidatus Falkowbacteria bacterium]